jgi:hypothetical protein
MHYTEEFDTLAISTLFRAICSASCTEAVTILLDIEILAAHIVDLQRGG